MASSEEGLGAKDTRRAVREQFGLGFLDLRGLARGITLDQAPVQRAGLKPGDEIL